MGNFNNESLDMPLSQFLSPLMNPLKVCTIDFCFALRCAPRSSEAVAPATSEAVEPPAKFAATVEFVDAAEFTGPAEFASLVEFAGRWESLVGLGRDPLGDRTEAWCGL